MIGSKEHVIRVQAEPDDGFTIPANEDIVIWIVDGDSFFRKIHFQVQVMVQA